MYGNGKASINILEVIQILGVFMEPSLQLLIFKVISVFCISYIIGWSFLLKKVSEYNWINSSIHPHQVHFEILSELGIVGYLSFIIFFTLSLLNFKKNINSKNRNFKLAGLFFIISTFLPLIPSGSFFTSHAATIFWMNYAFMNFSNEEI